MKKILLAFLFLFSISNDCSFADGDQNADPLKQGSEYHGLISVEDYYSNDSSSSYDFNFLTTRLRLDATKLNSSGTLSFHFDGRERNNLGSHDYNSSIPNERIDVLDFEYNAPRLFLSAGRVWTREVPVERLDGLNMVLRNGSSGIGFFGGLKPDPYSEEFNSDFTTFGAYTYYNKETLNASLALAHNGFNGATDRQYLYGQAAYTPFKEIRLFTTATVDRNQTTNGLSLTTGTVELSYSPDFTKNIAIGYNQFRAVQYFKSMTYEIDNSKQQAIYLSSSYRIDRYTLYGRVEQRYRYYPTLETEFKAENFYQLGVNVANLLYEVNMNANTSYTDSYDNVRHNSFHLEMSKLFREKLDLSANASYTMNEYDVTSSTDDVFTIGASGYLYLNKKWTVSCVYELEQGNGYTTNRLISRLSYKF